MTTRRLFLKESALAASALAMIPSLKTNMQTRDDAPAKLITRTLGRTGLVLPVVSMGVMRADNPGLLRAAVKAGVVHFDTAYSYQQGKNEEMIGKEFKEKPRDSFVIATKIGADRGGKASFLSRFEVSLKRLQMDHVDILYSHGPSSRDSVLDPGTVDALTEAKKSGKTRFVGLSTHQNEAEVILAAVESGIYDVVLTSINFKQDKYPDLKNAIAKAAGAGVGIIAMKTMAGGFLDKERTKPINCKAALKWVLQDPNVTTSIPGVTTFDQLAENLSVNTDLALTDKEKSDLAYGGSIDGLYCNACQHCVPTCTHSLPIPELMRAYMYTYGYSSPKMGRELVQSHLASASPCGTCHDCTASCIKGFDIRNRITDVARLRDVPGEFLA